MTRNNITLASTLDRSVETGAGDPAFIWLPLGEGESERLSYGDLQAKATAIARELPKTASHKLAALLYPPGLDFVSAFFGCMYAGFIGVPLNLPRAGRQTSQLEKIFADCAPSVILTTREHAARVAELVRTTLNSDAAVIATDEIPMEFGAYLYNNVAPGDIAYLQYTSGSTGTPKGVVINHENILANMEFIEHGFAHSSDALEVSWLPAFHDMGLVYGILQPVFGRFPCVMMPPQAFVQSPLRWLTAISKYRATHSGGPNFAYDLCAKSFKDSYSPSLDLSCWRVAFNGAEPVIAETLTRFERVFKNVGFQRSSFYPAYGLAESTLKVTGPQATEGPHEETFDSSQIALGNARVAAPNALAGIRLIGCGQPKVSDGIYIVDPETRQVRPESKIGEIWIKGPSVGQGYFNNDRASTEIFHAKSPDLPGDFLRSGDLGFLHKKQLYVTGRLKDLIVIYGKNYYPHDIERAAEQGQAQLRPRSTAAFSVPNSSTGTEELILVVETKAHNQEVFEGLAARVRDDLAQTLTLAAKQIIGVTIGSLPRTSSGKMKRAECRASFLSGDLKHRFVSALVEHNPTSLSEIHSSLETKSPKPNELGPSLRYVDSTFLRKLVEGVVASEETEASRNVRIVFDSITALQVAFRIEKEFGISIAPVDVLECKTIGDLDVLIGNSSVAIQESVNPGGDLPIRSGAIGFSQLSLLYQQVLATDSVALNVSRIVEILTNIDLPALQVAFDKVVGRHPILRACFPGFPEQQSLQIASEEDSLLGIEIIETNDLVKEIDRVVSQVFDLHRGPLFRMALIESADSNPLLILLCHHAICDLWSLSTLLDEFWEEYRRRVDGRTAEAHETDWGFDAYTRAEQEYAGTKRGKKAESYWTVQANRNIQALRFGRSRSREDVYRVEQQYFEVDRETVESLKAYASRLGVTLPELIFSAFQLLVGYYGRERVFRIGTSVHARYSARYEKAVGCMVNVLPVAGEYDAERSLRDAVLLGAKELRQATIHGDYPYYLNLQKMVHSNGDLSSNAIEVMFNFYSSSLSGNNPSIVPLSLGYPGQLIDFHGVRMKTHVLHQKESQHQMTLTCGEHNAGLLCTLECATSLFHGAYMQRIVGTFSAILARLAEYRNGSVGEFLADVDVPLRRHIGIVNDTKRAIGGWRTLKDAFVARAVADPEALALVEDVQSVTYGELHERMHFLAQQITSRGVSANDVIGICVERGVGAICGILGIVAANAAYMPIDPEFPDERIRKMIERANCRLILVSSQTAARIRTMAAAIAVVVVDQEVPECPEQDQEIVSTVIPESTAYVIFTSGSTGNPKGVMVDHRAICNRLEWMQEEYKLRPSDRVLQKTPFTFDVSIWEVFWPLLTGATLVLAKPGGHRDPLYLADLIEQSSVSVVHFVPSMLQAFLDATEGREFPTPRLVVCSGEALHNQVAERSLCAFPRARLDNLYGPTEAAVDVTSHSYRSNEEYSTVSIGAPISNVHVYVLDHLMFPVPVDIVGELYLGGIALAQGYIGAPGLTAERFVPNPFGNDENSRLYKTGDLVRWDSTGKLHYIGRTDNQIKLRGQRIELGEIETCLRRSARVKDCCVLVRETPAGENLVAYLLVADQSPSLKKELQDLLESTLPRYMVPSQFIQMTNFPITANGKLDTKSLPVIVERAPVAAQQVVANDRDEIEQELHEIWRDVLNVDQIDEEESFFALGGHSIAATQILARVRKQLGVAIPLALMFSEDVSISSLAEEIRSRKLTTIN